MASRLSLRQRPGRPVKGSVGWIFPGRGPDGHLTGDWLGRLIRAHLEALGIDGGVHRGRHRFGTEAARASGGDLLAVARLMGHTSPATSMGYTLLSGVRAHEVVEAMRPPAA